MTMLLTLSCAITLSMKFAMPDINYSFVYAIGNADGKAVCYAVGYSIDNAIGWGGNAKAF